MKAKGYAVFEKGGELKEYEYELPELKDDEASLDVINCGICHSDLSMINDDWGISQYPFIPGHEIIGKVREIGKSVKNIEVGDVVGIGFMSRSCLECDYCMGGDHNLCGTAEGIIVGRNGGFADKVNVQSAWLTKIPGVYDKKVAGPLFCGGLTVFNPIIENNIKSTDSVGVIGIGGLGHMALQFLNKWGCEVTAFSTNNSKRDECLKMGAHNFIVSKDLSEMKKLERSLNLILVTVNVPIDFDLYLSLLKPKGKIHLLGIPPQININAFSLISSQLSIGASPLGSPFTAKKMMEFSCRHNIKPVTEHFKFSDINKAIEHVKSGKPRYRVVLDISQ